MYFVIDFRLIGFQQKQFVSLLRSFKQSKVNCLHGTIYHWPVIDLDRAQIFRIALSPTNKVVEAQLREIWAF